MNLEIRSQKSKVKSQNKRQFVFCLLLSAFCFLGVGCSALEHYDELMTLKSLGDSQKSMESYLKKQEALFNKLKNHTKHNRLKKGISKGAIIFSYGEPLVVEKVKDMSQEETRFLYRHPTEYFSSDRIYLYFDKRNKLCSWKYESNS